jgi:hypothetical protein
VIKIILFEDHGDSRLKEYLYEKGYLFLIRLAVTTIVMDRDFEKELPYFLKMNGDK